MRETVHGMNHVCEWLENSFVTFGEERASSLEVGFLLLPEIAFVDAATAQTPAPVVCALLKRKL